MHKLEINNTTCIAYTIAYYEVRGKVCSGSWFSKEVKKWYEGIALKGPVLEPCGFPSITI